MHVSVPHAPLAKSIWTLNALFVSARLKPSGTLPWSVAANTRDIAEPMAYAVDEMGAERPKHPAAADRRSGRCSTGTPRKSQVQGGGDMARLANLAFIDELTCKGAFRRKAEFMGDHVRQASLIGQRKQFFCFCGVGGKRLLAHHVLAGLKGGFGHLIVQVGSGDDADSINVRMRHQLAVIRERVWDAEPFSRTLRPLVPARTDGHNFHTLGLKPGNMNRSPKPNTNNPNPNRWHSYSP